MHTSQHQIRTRQSGFTLLLAALVASIALTLGSALFSFATKQIALSSINKNSQFAFFNADSAAECALYLDNKGSVGTPVFDKARVSDFQVVCEGQSINVRHVAFPDSGPSWQSSTFTFTNYSPNNTPPQSQGSCANIIVTKTLLPNNNVGTFIEARGWSTSCATLNTSQTVLERGVRISY